MKKLFIPFFALVLAGGGCFSSAPTENSDFAQPSGLGTPGVADEMEDGAPSLGMPAPGFEDVEEMMVEDEDSMMEESDESDRTEEDSVEATAGGELNVTMDSGNFFFAPDTITASPGQTVHVTFASNGGFHTFVIDEINFKNKVEKGDTISFTAPTEPGSYPFYCDIGSHRALGMEGVLIVK